MKVNVYHLRPGYKLTKDVMGKTLNPIIPKGTVLTKQLIDILKEFDIGEVWAEYSNISGNSRDLKANTAEVEAIAPDLKALYLAAVKSCQRDFKNWQAGAKVKVEEVRDYLIPLFQYIENNPSSIGIIHHFSNKEEYLYHHAVSVGLLSGAIAQKMNLKKGDHYQAALAGFLADIGMARIPQHLLKKANDLTSMAFEEVKSHPVNSLKMIQHSSLLKPETKLAILQHHERLDRSGYPFGESPNRIPIMSRIVAVSDVYHAIVCDHIYKKRKIPFQAIEELTADYFGKFDISILNVLIQLVARLSIGTKVLLSNHEEAKVIYPKQTAPIKPLVKILSSGMMLDLEKSRDISIVELVK
ncbi:HD-GYP domain-containing protein [Heyndrickxia acidiproducens]|uniref:HD-GYP domain-containing protein n=1 Tax=Heyndrickxia acidiproducens TaxID=1121084 RepID=UPI00035F1F12|nr:HD domain-containing phosphohydrolase [Heyndrickxia acidiproducens]